MAQKQKTPDIIGSHLDNKFRQRTANITGRARRTIYTANNLSVTNNVTYEDVVTKTFSSKFFATPGDSLFFTISGQININASIFNTLQIVVEDAVGNTLISPGLLSVAAPVADTAIISTGHVYLTTTKTIGCGFHSGIYSSSGYQGFVQRSSSINSNSTGKIKIRLQYIGELLELDLFQVEYSPAVIN